MLEGERLVDANASFDQRTGEPIVQFRFDSEGARRFADITRKNVGKPFAVVLDDKILSALVIREPISEGAGQISGSFTVQAARDLAVLLRAGALPVPMKVIEERTVGADLGGDAIEQGVITGLIGFALVFFFMVVLYGAWASLAFAALSALGATLTLPGIAGIVLGVGLAVDANNLSMLPMALAGGTAVDNFAIAMVFGIVVGASSSIFVAAPILLFLGEGRLRPAWASPDRPAAAVEPDGVHRDRLDFVHFPGKKRTQCPNIRRPS